jgi:hypothetical protein
VNDNSLFNTSTPSLSIATAYLRLILPLTTIACWAPKVSSSLIANLNPLYSGYVVEFIGEDWFCKSLIKVCNSLSDKLFIVILSNISLIFFNWFFKSLKSSSWASNIPWNIAISTFNPSINFTAVSYLNLNLSLGGVTKSGVNPGGVGIGNIFLDNLSIILSINTILLRLEMIFAKDVNFLSLSFNIDNVEFLKTLALFISCWVTAASITALVLSTKSWEGGEDVLLTESKEF